MTTTFDRLAEAYRAGRLGYPNDTYNALIGYGLAPSHAVLDVGCGTGLASAPLIENNFAVTGIDPSEPMIGVAKSDYPNATWIVGRAESLPFADESFDAVISAQAFHHTERAKALLECKRVLRPRGIIAVWWKGLLGDDPVKQLRDAVSRELGVSPPSSLWRSGFREFYSAGFSETAMRVTPWSTITTLQKFLQYERSRKIVHDTFGSLTGAYVGRLEERLRETFGGGDPILPLSYMQYMYLGKK